MSNKIDTLLTGSVAFASSNAVAIATDTPNVIETVQAGSFIPDLSSLPGIINVLVQSIIGIITVVKFFKKPKTKQ